METEKLQASVIDSKWKNKYGLFAKHDVKMAGSNFKIETEARGNMQKNKRGQYLAILKNKSWSNKLYNK